MYTVYIVEHTDLISSVSVYTVNCLLFNNYIAHAKLTAVPPIIAIVILFILSFMMNDLLYKDPLEYDL